MSWPAQGDADAQRIRFSALGVSLTATKAEWLDLAAAKEVAFSGPDDVRGEAFTEKLLRALHAYATEKPPMWASCVRSGATGYRTALDLFPHETVRVEPA